MVNFALDQVAGMGDALAHVGNFLAAWLYYFLFRKE